MSGAGRIALLTAPQYTQEKIDVNTSKNKLTEGLLSRFQSGTM